MREIGLAGQELIEALTLRRAEVLLISFLDGLLAPILTHPDQALLELSADHAGDATGT